MTNALSSFSQYVIKKLNLITSSKRERRAAEQEAQLLSQLRHPNIVTYRESWEGDDCQLYIVMGFCEGGDLYHRLKQQKGELLPERQVVEWFVQIAMALQVSWKIESEGYMRFRHSLCSLYEHRTSEVTVVNLLCSTCMRGTFFTGTLKHRTSSLQRPTSSKLGTLALREYWRTRMIWPTHS